MPSEKREIGDEGERIAQKYLQRKGYHILETNYLKPFGEIDIIAENQGGLVFVEVKTRIYNNHVNYFPPEVNVHYFKGKKVERVANIYLSEKGFPESTAWQIDVVSVELNYTTRRAKITHFKNAVIG